MSDSNWGVRDKVVVSLFGLFLISVLATAIFATGISKGAHGADAQNAASTYSTEANQSIDERPVEPVIDFRECAEKIVSATRDAQRAEYDLNAQRNMAEWAFWLLVISALGLAITALGTVFLAWQVNLTREAVKDTGEATEAMREANKIAERNAQRQARAYIFVKSATIDDPLFPGHGLSLILYLNNAGQTPGEVKNISYNLSWLSSPTVDLIGEDSKLKTKIQPNCPYIIPFSIPDPVLGKCQEPGRFVFMGRIDYVDVFGIDHSEMLSFISHDENKALLDEYAIPINLVAFPFPDKEDIRAEKKKRKRASQKP